MRSKDYADESMKIFDQIEAEEIDEVNQPDKKHYFVPQADWSRFCEICDKYITDSSHIQTPALVNKQAC
jgi:hypothetical protein